MSAPILTDSQDAAAGDPVGALFVALRAVIAAAWPEVVGAGIYEADHADQVPWARLGVPRAVVTIENTASAPDWYKSGDVYLATVEVYYLCQVNGPLSQIRSKLFTLRRTLNKTPSNRVNVNANMSMGWGRTIPVNALLTQSESDIRVGRFVFTALIGEAFTA